MQECMSQYPELYGREDDDELSNAISESASEGSVKTSKAALALDPREAGDGPEDIKKTK